MIKIYLNFEKSAALSVRQPPHYVFSEALRSRPVLQCPRPALADQENASSKQADFQIVLSLIFHLIGGGYESSPDF